MNKRVFLAFSLILFLGTACSESGSDHKKSKESPQKSLKESSVIDWSGTPPLVGDEMEACPQCENPASIIVHRAPFKFSGPYGKLIVIDSGSSLTSAKINQAEGNQRGVVKNLYRRSLEEMQAVGGDSAYFTGEVMFKLEINPNGQVEKVQILSSSTDMPRFDQEILDSMKTWLFPKAKGKTVVTFPYRFVKTNYPRGYIDTTIGTL